MSSGYSAHPALASEQLQRAEAATRSHCSLAVHPYHRRHHSAGGDSCRGNNSNTPPKNKFSSRSAKLTSSKNAAGGTTALSSTTTNFSIFETNSQKTLPVRTDASSSSLDTTVTDIVDHDEVELHVPSMERDIGDDSKQQNTKDCVDCAPPPPSSADCTPSRSFSAAPTAFIDEPDQLQYRFSRTPQHQEDYKCRQSCANGSDSCVGSGVAIHAISDGCISGLSSTISSPSASTVSSPLSTPTRHTPHFSPQHSHQHCCQKAMAANGTATLSHLHIHHHQHHHHAAASSSSSGCKKLQKFDPRLGPSRYRQLLPILLCILSFAIVFSILIVYMDKTEIRHKQFRLNMSRDYELSSVAQDDPTLIAFLREIHMRKYPIHFLKNARDTTPTNAATAPTHFNFSAHYDGLTPEMAHYVADLVGGKMNGAVIQSLPGTLGHLMTAPWLAQTLNWAGVVVEPEPRRFFTLRKQNAQRPRLQVVHACVSPNPYPKEVTIHNEESEVRINSLLDEETSWFNSRVKCFPLYSIMLACNRVEYDLLSLGVHGHELEILQTLPFDKIQIEVISIHLPDDRDDLGRDYIQTLTKFLMGKSYKLQKRFGRNYFYQRINTTSRTRKKDILLLKTP